MVRGIASCQRPRRRSLGGNEAYARCGPLAGPDAHGSGRGALLFAILRRSHRTVQTDAGARSQLRSRPFPPWTRLPGQTHVPGSDRGVSKSRSVARRNSRDGDGYRIRGAMAGNAASARKALDRLKEQSRSRYVPSLYSAALYTSLGDSKDGIALLEKAYREHSDYLIFLNVDPMADSLRAIPSF